ncbi:hypothetical protein [Saccharomonospora sp. NB11]|jgi:hypothetical protein|uniref:hypothetical protein n=1 Tax=Saccharomonospora sp. NB11 TaxID=1642298 RepID=UPI0018D040A1|nr:hypothetical protein [Saccharomonospora sp. NB11]
MRNVRRGLVAAALAFPLAFGVAGVAAADEVEGSIDWASYEAEYASATYQGAEVEEIESEALHAEFEADVDGKHQRSGEARHDKGDEHKGVSVDVDWASYEAEGAAADATGAAVGEIEAEAAQAEID